MRVKLGSFVAFIILSGRLLIRRIGSLIFVLNLMASLSSRAPALVSLKVPVLLWLIATVLAIAISTALSGYGSKLFGILFKHV